MNRKQFALYGMAIVVALGAIVGYSVSIKNALLPVVAVIAGIILLSFGKRNVTEVLEDERIYRISEKASRRTLQILGIGMASVGMSMIALDKHAEVGYALAFSACVLVLLYLVFYSYYNRKSIE